MLLKLKSIFVLLFLCLTLPLNAQNIKLSFTVKDIDTRNRIAEVNMYAYDKDNEPVFEGSTNSLGIYTITTAIQPGQRIRVLAQKAGYRLFEEEFLIEDPKYDRNRWEIALIPKGPRSNTEGNQSISGHVYDANKFKKGKRRPVKDVQVDIEVGGRLIPGAKTDKRGYFIVYYDFEVGQEVTLYFNKQPDYENKDISYVFKSGERNVIKAVTFEKTKLISPEYFVMGGGALVGISSILIFNRHKTLYNRYNDLDNLELNYQSEQERQDDFDKAKSLKGLGTTGMIIGGTAIVSGLVYRLFFKYKKGQRENPGLTFRMPVQYDLNSNSMQVGIALQF